MKDKNNPLKITDTTFRDAHQSALATRLRTRDLEQIAGEMDGAGFYSMEVWGGATFDVTTRFLNEDPWERVRLLKKLMPKTPLQMLLRGQNLVGYRHYPDDVVRAFVHHAAEVGIDIFRVFDAVNDERNFEAALATIKECGKHAQLTLCYSLTERRMGGPVYNLEYYLKRARVLQDMGADSLCIKDMAGIIAPYDAFELITALKAELKIPVQIHTHYTSGMASMSYLKAIEAGVDIIDTALAPFALRTSQPAVEPIAVALQGTPRDTGLDLGRLLKLGAYFEEIAPKYRDYLAATKMSVIDTQVLLHQVPGGMLSNLTAQLREADALDRIEEVYAEIPRTRKELGNPPLVTPTSQIVGIQAVQNVLFGRYQMVSQEVKDYVGGLYGRPPARIDPKVQSMVLGGGKGGKKPITGRPGDILEPEMEKAKEATRDIARDVGDVLIYALYPTTGMRFLRWKYGLEEPPPETRPKTLEEVKKEDELAAQARSGELSPAPAKRPGMRAFDVYVGEDYYRVEVGIGTTGAIPGAAIAGTVPPPPAPQEAAPGVTPTPLAGGETAIEAPLPGMVIRYEAKVGQRVAQGDVVVMFEAMKMQNALAAPREGTVKRLGPEPGAKVGKGDVLAVIGE